MYDEKTKANKTDGHFYILPIYTVHINGSRHYCTRLVCLGTCNSLMEEVVVTHFTATKAVEDLLVGQAKPIEMKPSFFIPFIIFLENYQHPFIKFLSGSIHKICRVN
ncbi:hypothetical protein R9C00_24870 [Flammeovirgaceae bacterium SG7u.111]|nr:hypothetical protein [Flammeovirgaceae bacterium SG7u.132]WPO34932.1 hypothetical protein R9C00_24870 [Flammeovirgaceae bacterium SG7u.111]